MDRVRASLSCCCRSVAPPAPVAPRVLSRAALAFRSQLRLAAKLILAGALLAIAQSSTAVAPQNATAWSDASSFSLHPANPGTHFVVTLSGDLSQGNLQGLSVLTTGVKTTATGFTAGDSALATSGSWTQILLNNGCA
jgi:hypothetical protein